MLKDACTCKECGAALCPDCNRGDCSSQNECDKAKIRRLEAENAGLKQRLAFPPQHVPTFPQNPVSHVPVHLYPHPLLDRRPLTPRWGSIDKNIERATTSMLRYAESVGVPFQTVADAYFAVSGERT